jgi:hypothetical protein
VRPGQGYEGEAYELRSCDLAVHFYRRARMNGASRRSGLVARLRAMLARREPSATACDRCGLPLNDLELAHVVVQAGRVCRRCATVEH